MTRFVAIALLAFSALAQAQSKKVVFLAGPKDHGAPGRHEYEKDLRVLAKCLETSTNLKDVTTKVFVGKTDLKELADASVIVIESSSDRDAKEHHPLFPQDPSTDHTKYDADTTAYLKEFDGLMKKGVGIVILHYATWAENVRARQYYLDWTGGLWVQAVSRNPFDTFYMALKNTSHPVLRGVKPWSYKDEVFCRFFRPEDGRRTELVVANPSRGSLGPQVAAWAFQREDGHRAFVMGGVDLHSNMALEDYRKFLLNGIAWAGGIEVPEEGVASSVSEESLK